MTGANLCCIITKKVGDEMKLRVIGWTYYDDDLQQGELGWAARNAIIDDIKKHGYMFSGWAHQECDCCAPVLNDGKIYCYSQRGWGGIMAEAHGYTGRMDYAKFAFAMDMEEEIRPKDYFDEDTFEPEYHLNERFELEVSKDIFASAEHKLEIKLDDLPELRYLDNGDTLALVSGENKAEFTVVDVDRTKDLTEDEQDEIWSAHYDLFNEERAKRAEETFANAKVVMIVKLK